MNKGNFFDLQNQTKREFQKKVKFENQLSQNDESEPKIQLSIINNCEDERLIDGGTLSNYNQLTNKNFQELSSIGSDTRKEVQDFIEGQTQFYTDTNNQDQIDGSYSDYDYDDEQGSNENESVLDKTVILEQGVYEKIMKEEEPYSTKRIKKHRNPNAVNTKRRASKQEQKVLRAGNGDETRKISDSQTIQDGGLRLTFGPQSMKTKVAILSQEISPIEVPQHSSEFKDLSLQMQFNNFEQNQQQSIQQDDDTSKTVNTQESQFNQKNGIQQDIVIKTESSLTLNQVQVSESIEQNNDNQMKEEESKIVQQDNKSKEGGLFPTDEENEEEEAEQKFVFVSPTGRFKRFSEELGRGAYKTVYRGVDHDTGREVAWSLINISNLPKSERPRINSEIQLIKQLDHPNIITFISAWISKETEQIHFITEMITGGSLRQYLKKMGNPKLKVIKKWCHEILQGLNYLHTQKIPIIHRDIKCDNIFVNSNSGDIKIGDLGLSTTMKDSYTSSVLGTPEFMAPELYEEHYGTEVDIYAFGMAVLEMLTQEAPYRECQNPAQIYRKVVNRDFPKSLERINDLQVYSFITWCLAERKNRPSAEQLLQSEFMLDKTSANNEKPVSLLEVQKIVTKFPQFKHRDLNGSLEGIPEQEEPVSQIMTGKIQNHEYQYQTNNDTAQESHIQDNQTLNSQITNIQDLKLVQNNYSNFEESQNDIVQTEINQQSINENDRQIDKIEEKQQLNIEKQNSEQIQNQDNQVQLEEKQIISSDLILKSQENSSLQDQKNEMPQQNEKLEKNPQDNQTDSINQNDSIQTILFPKKVSQNIESPRFFDQQQEKAESVESQSLSQSANNSQIKNEQTFIQPKSSITSLKDIILDVQYESNLQAINQNIEESIEKQSMIKFKSEFIKGQQNQEQNQNSPGRIPERKTSNIFQYGSPQKRQGDKHINQLLQDINQSKNIQQNNQIDNKPPAKVNVQQQKNENQIGQLQGQNHLPIEEQSKTERQKFIEETQSFLSQSQSNVHQQSENIVNPAQQNNLEEQNKVPLKTIFQQLQEESKNEKQQSQPQVQSQQPQDEQAKKERQKYREETLNFIYQNQSHTTNQPLNQSISQVTFQKIISINSQESSSLNNFQNDQFVQPQEVQSIKQSKEKDEIIKRNDSQNLQHNEKKQISFYPFKKQFIEDKEKNYQPRSQIMDVSKLKYSKKNSSSSRQDRQNEDQLKEKQKLQQSVLDQNLQNMSIQDISSQQQNQQQRSRSSSLQKSHIQATLNLNSQNTENQQFEQVLNSISVIDNQPDQITDRSEVGSSKDLGGLIQQLNYLDNKYDQNLNQKNDSKQKPSIHTKTQIQSKQLINIQLTSSIKQSHKRQQKIERSEIIEFKKKMQTALKPKQEKDVFDNQEPGRIKEISTRENIRKQTGTPNYYASRKEQTRSVPPQKSPKNNKNSIQEPQTTKISSKKQIDKNISTQKQKDQNLQLGNQTTIISDIQKIENLEILEMTINFGDNVVTFEFCLGRDTPEQVANDFAVQMKLDVENKNQFCQEIHEKLKKHQEKKKSAQQRGRNGSGKTTKENQIEHSNSFFNSQYSQFFNEYQKNNITIIKDNFSKGQSTLQQERGERTNEKPQGSSKLNDKILLQQSEDLPVHKLMRQSMLEMNNNNNLCELNQKETQKVAHDNESLQQKKQLVKESIIMVTKKAQNIKTLNDNDNQQKIGVELIQKVKSPENKQMIDAKQYKVTNSSNHQQRIQQKSPTSNNIQIKNQEMNIIINENIQNNSQIKKILQDQIQVNSPLLDSRTNGKFKQQNQQRLQTLFKNMKNSIREFFEEINTHEIQEVTQLIGKSDQFQTTQLQNEFIQSLKEINYKFLVQKDLRKDADPVPIQTLNSKILQANIKQIGKSPQTQNNATTQKLRPNKESFNIVKQQNIQPQINSRALQEQAKSVVKRVKIAVKDSLNNKQKMEQILIDQNNIILQKKQDSKNEHTVDITDNSSIKASAGSSSSSIMTVALQASTQAEQMKNLWPLINEDDENSEQRIISDIKILQGKLDLPQDGIVTQKLVQDIEKYLIRLEFKNKSTADFLKKTKIYSNYHQKPINQQPNNQQNGGEKQFLQKSLLLNQKKQGHGGSQSFSRQKSLQPGDDKKKQTLFAEQSRKNQEN